MPSKGVVWLEQYRIKKRAVSVDVRLSNGEIQTGFLFCSERSEKHHGRETVEDLLNDPTAVVALRASDGFECALINKAHIEVVAVHGEDGSSEFAAFSQERIISVQFVDGARLTGRLLLSSPPGEFRTLDFLNRGERFFSLETDDARVVVSLAHVAVVYDTER